MSPSIATATTAARRLIQPVAAVVIIALVAVIALVWTTARNQDAIAVESSRALIRSIVEEARLNLGRTVFDHSRRAESIERLVLAPDATWADGNVGTYAAETFEIGESFVVAADGRTTFAFMHGVMEEDVDALNDFGEGLRTLILRARAAPMERPEPVTGFVVKDGLLHLLAASAITPEQPESEDVVPRPRAVLVYARHVDAVVLARLSQDLNLAELRVEAAAPAARAVPAFLAMAGPDGAPVAWLTWRPATPGTDLFLNILPWLVIGSLVFLGLLFVFYQRVRAAGARMEADARALADRERQLAQTSKLAVLGEMAAGIVHELNQPLNIVRMAADSMAQSMDHPATRPDAGDIREQFSLIAGQAMRMAEIVQNMRLFSRDDFGRKLAFDPRSAVEQALWWMRSELAAKEIELVFHAPASTGQLYGEVARFEQVVVNLVANARDAILRSGTPPVDATAVGRIDVSITDDLRADTVVVAVGDTGGGISPEAIERVFEPFFTTKGEGEGMGLGLSISYGIISGMDGTLAVRNGPAGAVFTAVLPRLAPAQHQAGRDVEWALP